MDHLLSERERIERQIFAQRKARDVYAAHGDAADADKCLDTIGDLERQIEQINQREREARKARG
jgi:hypothetical protein